MPRVRKISYRRLRDLAKCVVADYLEYLRSRRDRLPNETDQEWKLFCSKLKGSLSIDEAEFARKSVKNFHDLAREAQLDGDEAEEFAGKSSEELELEHEKVLKMSGGA